MNSSRTTVSPRNYDGAIFDLDGVITDTAVAHLHAWKEVFDELVRRRLGEDARPFSEDDYRRRVDGKPRFEGIRSFAASRGIELPKGSPDDPPGYDTVFAVGRHKNRLYRRYLEQGQLEVLDDSVEFARNLQCTGVALGLVSSSRNAAAVLEITGLQELFEVRVDGETLARLDLQGKPAPDMFVEAARRLGVCARRCLVVEDAEAGVEAGRAGGFALVVGLSEDAGQRRRLLEAGADVAVATLAELQLEDDRSD